MNKLTGKMPVPNQKRCQIQNTATKTKQKTITSLMTPPLATSIYPHTEVLLFIYKYVNKMNSGVRQMAFSLI